MKRSERRVSLSGIQSAELKPFTAAAMRVGSCAASNRVIGPTPLTPASRFFHASAAPMPTGETMPSPVTTTLRFDMGIQLTRRTTLRRPRRDADGLLLDVRLDVIDGLLDGGDLLGVLVGNLALEFLFERHHQLDVVERVRAKIFDEGRFVLDFSFGDAELFRNDLLDACFKVVHRVPPLLFMRFA